MLRGTADIQCSRLCSTDEYAYFIYHYQEIKDLMVFHCSLMQC